MATWPPEEPSPRQLAGTPVERAAARAVAREEGREVEPRFRPPAVTRQEAVRRALADTATPLPESPDPQYTERTIEKAALPEMTELTMQDYRDTSPATHDVILERGHDILSGPEGEIDYSSLQSLFDERAAALSDEPGVRTWLAEEYVRLLQRYGLTPEQVAKRAESQRISEVGDAALMTQEESDRPLWEEVEEAARLQDLLFPPDESERR